MTPSWRTPAGLHLGSSSLPVESRLPSFDGASGWLNSPVLTPQALRGHVVLVNFWTYTCVNWLRQLPYVRAWAAKYAGDGLVVVGVHTPEFPFEHDLDNVRRAVKDMGVTYPVAVDNDYAVWEAFANHYWPALYVADAEGRIRYHQFGEGAYARSEMVVQQLLTSAGATPDLTTAAPSPTGPEVAADWADLRTPENYTGYARTVGFAGDLRPGTAVTYRVPSRLRLNEWALSGPWEAESGLVRAAAAGAGLTYRFQGRDLNVVAGPPAGGPARFRVLLDGVAPGDAAGGDVDAAGLGEVSSPRLHQVIRQPGTVAERTFEITFLDPGAEVYCFTFG